MVNFLNSGMFRLKEMSEVFVILVSSIDVLELTYNIIG